MALPFSRDVEASAIIYDCMDELSAFAGAPPRMVELERELFGIADLVFTGGRSLYEAKRTQHRAVYCFASSVDVPHFAGARRSQSDVPDMADIPHPRLGFYGVLDERMDLELLDGLAAARPEWHIVLLGPVAKIEEQSLPRRPNLHYPGPRSYDDLPAYLAGWDVALLPFARNESTRFISPTKTPEYLAAGKPVVSTSIPDVVHPYGEMGLVQIADTVEDTVIAIETALAESPNADRQRVDELLSSMSWDNTWAAMNDLVLDASRSLEAASV
jgi:UDP-galactopyranose mutase